MTRSDQHISDASILPNWHELGFRSAIAYEDPFNTVTLDVVFTEPGGKIRRIPAYWAGDDQWRVRYSSRIAGLHSYRTECSDRANAGLHGINGTVCIASYQGDQPLLKHGAPIVAADHRHFTHEDGTPFFWLGDTWWMGLTDRLRWPDEFSLAASNRAEKGFTVIQLVAGLYPDMGAFDQRGQSTAGFPWTAGFGSIRPAFFDEADQKILHLVRQGLVPCIVGAWGYYLTWMGVDRMKAHWRYLVARWGALPVVWCAAGEQTMPWYLSENKPAETAQLRQGWTEVIRYIREIDGFHRLLTTHPVLSARDSVIEPGLLDFEMQQTGHGQQTGRHASQAHAGWKASPVMPVISGESRYEALEIDPAVTTRDVRQAFWAHLLNSGCAGHTYGANGLWQVNRKEYGFGKSPLGHDWGGTPWEAALDLPGSGQLAVAKRFLEGLPWHRFEVSGRLAGKWYQRSGTVPAVMTADGLSALCYIWDRTSVSVNTGILAGPVRAGWLDPVNGAVLAASAAKTANRHRHTFTIPGKNAGGDDDWILLLKAGETA
ncbi:hypothetical protein MTYP_01279 [Methylophilaceae bacterium]|nr:hypothetical protein MTYP_01279 [Methylophilaceae bacterium]